MRIIADTGTRLIDTAASIYSPRLPTAWRYRIQTSLSKSSKTSRRFSIIFPDFAWLNRRTKKVILEKFVALELFLEMRKWKHCASLNIVIEDPHWPLPVPGEDIFYERLHRGLTRRGLIKAREDHAKNIALWLIGIVSRWENIVTEIFFTFGQTRHGSENVFDEAKEFCGLVSMVKKGIGNKKVKVL